MVAANRPLPALAAVPLMMNGLRPNAGKKLAMRAPCAKLKSTWNRSPRRPAKWKSSWDQAGQQCLLHEAVGHGLEGDFNRKGTSVYSGRVGEQVASKGVTVIDDGTIDARRGSLSVDDEGTPTNRTVLIEDGILKGYMQDRQNARLMGVAPTGNGRREAYDATIMPRMTNTVMLGGQDDPDEIVASIKKGIWAVDFGGGQVDITSGNFVFQCTEAYLVENGKVVAPVKNATLIGHGPTALSQVEMIGNDFAMDDGVGTCGKAGQSVPVGVGQPTLKVGGLTVGGAG